ncbi:glycosyltransferase [Tropicimonas marinistellae]|uniref:glycosyltransferase n=1 Tax=Tropicimonas marinistellae TaxID=1739787 RepID=UPI00082A0C55|nr:glycosyltransferase [Tropicimonas marinistellae]
MKILYYNWVDYLDPERRGGGVSVYQRNLIAHLGEKDDLSIRFICSGISYDMFSTRPRWEKIRHGSRDDSQRRFELVNSGVLAPGHHSFGHQAQIDHPETVDAFCDFVSAQGPFDIVHFNNLEGIPASVISAIKARFPGTKVILSLHNYYPVCPQVNLWHKERENCLDYDGGRKCGTCLKWQPDPDDVRSANAVAFALKKLRIEPGGVLFGRSFALGTRASKAWLKASQRWKEESREVLAFDQSNRDCLEPREEGDPLARVIPDSERFRQRREDVARILNENCDRILCVSNRVAQVAAKFGIDQTLLETSYIGTKHAELYETTQPKTSLLKPDGTVTLGFMGYMRRDKGYYFLMKALASLPDSLARRIRLVVCAKKGEKDAMELLRKAADNLCEVRHANGYSHDQIDRLLEDVDVGVVPVQWEDNLPQVAIEMHARHIPLLTSDLGGAQEVGNAPSMVFEANSIASFRQRIREILENRIDLDAYWRNAMPPVSMEDHEESILDIYRDVLKPEDASREESQAAAAE